MSSTDAAGSLAGIRGRRDKNTSLRLQAFPGEVAAADALRDAFDRLVQRDVVDDARLGFFEEADAAQPGAHLQQQAQRDGGVFRRRIRPRIVASAAAAASLREKRPLDRERME